MLDRKEYDLEMDRVNKEEIEEIIRYLKKYIEKNANMRDEKLNSLGNQEAIEAILKMDIPVHSRDFKEVADEAIKNIFECQTLLQHPRYLALVCTYVSPYALLGSILGDIYNINTAGYSLCPSATLVEEKLISFMAGRIGFDTNKSTGVFTSGGSLSNMTGMVAAREEKLNHNRDLPRAVAYCSDQAHSSIKKGMRMIGLRPDQIRILPVDENFRIRIDLLTKMIEEDVKNGLRPFLVVGSCGTTNTGSIDPFDDIADLAEKYDMWFHIDGAYGGSILFSNIYNHLAKGCERCDSFSWDTHKWSLQPYSSSVVIARDKTKWINAFIEHPEYLADTMTDEHLNGWDRGIEMSRPFRAIKLWFTLQTMGTDKLADVIDYSFFNCKTMETELLKDDYWQIMAPSCCAALNFRLAPKEVDPKWYDEMTHRCSEIINDDGYAYILTTTLNGNICMRVCIINGNTTTEDILNTVEYLNNIARKLIEEYKGK